MGPKELAISAAGLEFSAQAWGNPNHFPILALHGWLDNSASFSALAPLLADVYLVALDLAGHGRSAHRPGNSPYNIWEDIPEVFSIADSLGWDQFALLGHSRGGIIATLAAGTFPERISHLALIEGVLPEPVIADDAPAQLARSIKSMRLSGVNKLSNYPDISSAIKARENGMFPLSYLAAKALTERGLRKSSDGYYWSTDRRLLLPSSVKYLPEQASAFISRITCPITLVLASDGMPKIHPNYVEAINQFQNINVKNLSGGHHLHMEEQAAAVANIFNDFFANKST